MNIRLHPLAERDLAEGAAFYEEQDPGAGSYFLRSMSAEIDSLHRLAGIHRKVHGIHRLLTGKFPFAIFYSLQGATILVQAVLDLRQHPGRITQRLRVK